jgi:hypothetical protein
MALFLFSCSETQSNTVSKDNTEITEMDSTAKAAEEKREKLDDQTSKVEESLEKLDKEFQASNK